MDLTDIGLIILFASAGVLLVALTFFSVPKFPDREKKWEEPPFESDGYVQFVSLDLSQQYTDLTYGSNGMIVPPGYRILIQVKSPDEPLWDVLASVRSGQQFRISVERERRLEDGLSSHERQH